MRVWCLDYRGTDKQSAFKQDYQWTQWDALISSRVAVSHSEYFIFHPPPFLLRFNLEYCCFQSTEGLSSLRKSIHFVKIIGLFSLAARGKQERKTENGTLFDSFKAKGTDRRNEARNMRKGTNKEGRLHSSNNKDIWVHNQESSRSATDSGEGRRGHLRNDSSKLLDRFMRPTT